MNVNTSQPQPSQAFVQPSSGPGVARRLSVPSRRATTAQVVHHLRDDDGDSSIRQDVPSEDNSSTTEDIMPFFNDDASELADDVGMEESESNPNKVLFSLDKVKPILRAAAQAAGAEFIEDDVEQPSLLFGNLTQKSSQVTPVVTMPPDVHALQSRVNKAGTKLTYSKLLQKSFRVSEEDYHSFFRVPALDVGAVNYLKPDKSAKQQTFLPAKETMLSNMDRHVRSSARIASFQLMIMNALTINLSDGNAGEDIDQPDGSFAMAKLSTALASELLRNSMKLSHHIGLMRRQNVYFGIRNKYKDELVSRLRKLESDSEYLFAGEFMKVFKKVAKDIQSRQSMDKPFTSFSQSTSSDTQQQASTSSTSTSRGSGYRGKNRGRNKNNKSRGSFRNNATQQGSNQRGSQRGRGQDRGRRGKPWSRF